MAETKKPKLIDDKWKKVIVSHRTDIIESPQTTVGGSVVIDGKIEVRHYHVKLGEVVELPESYIKQLKNRAILVKGPDGQPQKK